jgi:hypothetical protein
MNEPLDLTIALKKLHELAQEEGDLGYAYWYAVAKLLKDAQGLKDAQRLAVKKRGGRVSHRLDLGPLSGSD